MQPRRKRARGTLSLLLAVSAVTSACTNAPRPPERAASEVLVGEADGGKALIAIVHNAEAITVYTCGVNENLKTHTGWFNGGSLAAGTIPQLASARGLLLDGRISDGAASGTLKLTSGEVVPWKAERSNRRGAGLYAAQDSVALMGLIVTNDGRMAGNAQVNQDDGSGSDRPPTRSEPVETQGGQPPSSSDEPVQGSFDNGDSQRTSEMPPVDRPRTITKQGPVVIVLVHGMSDKLPGPAASNNVVKCEGPPDTPFYGRCEWGIDFIPGVFGSTAAETGLVNLAGDDVSGPLFISDTDAQEPIDENLNITQRDANGCVTDPNAREEYDQRAAMHFVTTRAMEPKKSGPRGARPVPPLLSVLTTWRDQTRGVVESGRRVARQTYAALKWWEEEYGQSPAVIFVTQSFGGLATRFILSNPPQPTYDIPALNPDGIVLCPEDRAKMDYLRDRTVYAVTLATPHEGSYLAEIIQPAKEMLTTGLRALRDGTNNSPLVNVWRAAEASATALMGRPVNLLAFAQKAIEETLDLLDTPALHDMQFSLMQRFNNGALSPERALRTSGSTLEGAKGRLVPIYATLARSPGGAAFDSPEVIKDATQFEAESEKEKGWIISTMIVDILIKQFVRDGFGRVDVEPYATHAALLDRRGRVFGLSRASTLGDEFVARASAKIIEKLAPYFIGRYADGLKGVLRFLRENGTFPSWNNAVLPIHLDREWRLGLSGRTEVPMAAFACQNSTIVLDYNPLVRAVLRSTGTTQKFLDGLRGAHLGKVIQATGKALKNNVALARDSVAWLGEKAAAVDDAPEACRLPRKAKVEEFFKLANVFRWKLIATTGRVPSPAWERTTKVARDREMDTDGPVHSASALGFTLGRFPFFFEHNRDDAVVNGRRSIGSWYRLPDGPGEAYNHGLQYQNEVGRWIQERFLANGIGPVPMRESDSAWTE